MSESRLVRSHWRIASGPRYTSIWPIALEHTPYTSRKAPIWVWGDLALARRVARGLNRKERKHD